jgi:Ras-related protein Rab-2A
MWIEEIKDYGQENINLMLIGNKIDLEEQRQVGQEEGKAFAKENQMMFFETCAMKSNVKECFVKIVTKIVSSIENGSVDPYDERNGVRVGSLVLGNHSHTNDINFKQKKKSSCC